MSHAAKQIRAWFVTSLTGVGGLPTARAGRPPQIAAGASACYVTHGAETITPMTIHDPRQDDRSLAVQVVLVAASLDAADALSVLAEEAIEAATGAPAEVSLESREYDEEVETDRVVVSITLTYAATYIVAANDVETIL